MLKVYIHAFGLLKSRIIDLHEEKIMMDFFSIQLFYHNRVVDIFVYVLL